MMKPAVLSAMLLTLSMSAISTAWSADTASSRAEWDEKMDDLAATIGRLMPELVKQQPDKAALQREARHLAGLAHALKPGLASGSLSAGGDLDPGIGIVAGNFSQNAEQAYHALQTGNDEYGRTKLRSLLGYCIACHTRHDQGPAMPAFALDSKDDQLSRPERAELYVATRQFDRGYQELAMLAWDADFARTHPLQWDKYMRMALALAVRIKNDPATAAHLVHSALQIDGVPDYLRSTLQTWQTSIAGWTADQKKAGQPARLEAMRQLMQQARARQAYPADRSADVELLRAQRLAHELLSAGPDARTKAEALSVAGDAAAALDNYLAGPVQDAYWAACVQTLPHTSLAMSCYNRYEQSTYAGFSGSSGTHVPPDERAVLRQLKAQAGR